MSRGSKYSAEEKLKIVEACLSGAIGVREAGRRVGADGKTIGRWISWYKAEGSSIQTGLPTQSWNGQV